MQPDEGYQEARRLLKSRYGQSYKIATAYVNRVTNGPLIRHEDGEALQKLSVLQRGGIRDQRGVDQGSEGWDQGLEG